MEFELQCTMAIDAFESSKDNLRAYIKIFKNSPTELSSFEEIQDYVLRTAKEKHRFFRNIHSCIVSHANISKLFYWKGDGFKGKNKFPGSDDEKDKIKEHLKMLRKGLLSFNENDRELRDHIEHFDERLINTAYFSDVSTLGFAHSSSLDERREKINKENYLREIIFDENQIKYIVRGKNYDLRSMVEDILKLNQRVQGLTL